MRYTLLNGYCILILVILTCALGETIQNKSLPFCQICSCAYNNNTSTNVVSADVICTKSIPYSIFQDDFWSEKNTTKPFAYNSINFQNNVFKNLTYIFPPSNLTYMNLANNAIYGITDSVFQNLQNMKTLILSYNDLEIIHPDAFKGIYMQERLLPLRNLKELRLDHNKLHTLNQDIFEHTTDIEILDLSHNPIETIDHHTLAAISSLSYIKELYLQYTGIKTLPENMLHTPKYLQILDLSGNPIEQIPATLAQAHSITDLYMNNTGFVNLTQENGFPRIPSLKVLHLCRNEHLSHLQKHAFSGLINLEDLRVCDNIDLVNIDPMAMATMTNTSGGAVWPPIKKLYIGNNKISYLDSDIIARWDGLSELDIRHNPWTCECENQWLIEDLMPIYLKIERSMAMEVRCAAPVEMESYTFYELYLKKSQMRCLDVYGARPENDATMLVGVLAGVLIAIPTILFLIFAYQRRWFSICGICDNSPAAYSRRFYRASPSDDYM